MSFLGVVVFVVQKTSPKADTKLPLGLKSPGLAIEFSSLSEVGAILGPCEGDDSPMRKQIRQGLYGDYCFIAMYWLLQDV